MATQRNEGEQAAKKLGTFISSRSNDSRIKFCKHWITSPRQISQRLHPLHELEQPQMLGRLVAVHAVPSKR